MGASTFSGPLRVGKTGNAGSVPVAYQIVVPFGAITTSPAGVAGPVLPPNSRIVGVMAETTKALTGATGASVTVGKQGGGPSDYATAITCTAAVGRVSQVANDAKLVMPACIDTGPAEATPIAVATAAGANATAGEIVVTLFALLT